MPYRVESDEIFEIIDTGNRVSDPYNAKQAFYAGFVYSEVQKGGELITRWRDSEVEAAKAWVARFLEDREFTESIELRGHTLYILKDGDTRFISCGKNKEFDLVKRIHPRNPKQDGFTKIYLEMNNPLSGPSDLTEFECDGETHYTLVRYLFLETIVKVIGLYTHGVWRKEY